MSADLLRLILFIAGVGLILGIYYWERQKRIDSAVHAVRRERELEEHTLVEPAEAENELPQPEAFEDQAEVEITTEVDTEGEVELELELADELPSLPAFVMQPGAETEESRITEELEQLDELVSEEKETQSTKGEQIPLFFASEEDEAAAQAAPATPSKIVLINVKAREGYFSGRDVLEVAMATGLEHGEMGIFHRVNLSTASNKGAPLFSMASMVEPGTFPREQDAIEEFSTPGLALFLQLPSRGDDLALFNDMLATAEHLAQQLGGELQDETHSVLTRQTIEHLREEIIELKRQQRLAQKKL
jgi:cell division protein ZipA